MVKTASELTDVITAFGDVLEGMGIHWERILLFGSYRNGNPHEGSDIDLVVVAPDWKDYNLLQRLETLGLAAVQLLEPIQAYGVTQDEIDKGELSTFWDYIVRDQSVTVLERRKAEPVMIAAMK